MENLIVKARLIKKANNDIDMNMLMIGNNVIMLNNNMLNNIIVEEPVVNSRYEFINDSGGEWIRDKETGVDYSTKIGMRLINKYFH